MNTAAAFLNLGLAFGIIGCLAVVVWAIRTVATGRDARVKREYDRRYGGAR